MPDDSDLSPPYGVPLPDDLPTPPSGLPLQPYFPDQQGGGPWGSGPPSGEIPIPDPGQPSYLDTPAPVVGKSDTDKPPADFDG